MLRESLGISDSGVPGAVHVVPRYIPRFRITRFVIEYTEPLPPKKKHHSNASLQRSKKRMSDFLARKKEQPTSAGPPAPESQPAMVIDREDPPVDYQPVAGTSSSSPVTISQSSNPTATAITINPPTTQSPRPSSTPTSSLASRLPPLPRKRKNSTSSARTPATSTPPPQPDMLTRSYWTKPHSSVQPPRPIELDTKSAPPRVLPNTPASPPATSNYFDVLFNEDSIQPVNTSSSSSTSSNPLTTVERESFVPKQMTRETRQVKAVAASQPAVFQIDPRLRLNLQAGHVGHIRDDQVPPEWLNMPLHRLKKLADDGKRAAMTGPRGCVLREQQENFYLYCLASHFHDQRKYPRPSNRK